MPVDKPLQTHGRTKSNITPPLARNLSDGSLANDVTASLPSFLQVEASLIQEEGTHEVWPSRPTVISSVKM